MPKFTMLAITSCFEIYGSAVTTITGQRLYSTAYLHSPEITDDGAWHYVEDDLKERIQTLTGSAPVHLDYIYFDIGGYTAGLRLDDLIFSAGKLRRSYQVIAGGAVAHEGLWPASATIGGALRSFP